MKKKKIALIIAIACITLTTAFAACSVTPAEHTHIYSDEWTADENYHWHNAICSHMSETKDKAPHEFDEGEVTEATFESEGYITYRCTICGYDKRETVSPALEHSYSDALSYDDDSHWYACLDEGYESLKKDEASHVLTEVGYDESTGYATYSCVCGFEKQYLRAVITELPVVSDETIYVGQKLADVVLSGGAASVEGTFAWTSADEAVTDSGNYSVTFTPLDADYPTLTASVEIIAVQLTVTVNVGKNGSASAIGSVNVNYSDPFTVTFAPDAGYVVGTLTVDGDEVVAVDRYTFDSVTESHVVAVTFVEWQNVASFTVKCVSGTENAYTVAGNTITFTTVNEDTVYAVSGELEGNIVIDADATGTYKFGLELTGFTLTCDYVNPITVLSGKEVSITAKKGYENYIYDNREAIDTENDELYSAAIYSLVDLEICGKGKLTLISENNNGIHTKDDLLVKNLTLSVTCSDNALKGNDGVEINGAVTTLIATRGDCIKSTNSNISSQGNQKGTVLISSGTHNLYAACDAIDSSYNVIVEDDSTVINIYTDKYSEYSKEVTAVSENVYYLRYTSAAYKYSIKYYNSDDDFLWVNVSDSYEKVTLNSFGGRPGQNVGTTYYYYTFDKKAGYAAFAVYMYSASQEQGQDSDYYACSDYKAINSGYDTVALSYSAGKLSLGWTNYTTTSYPTGGPGGGMQQGNSDKGDYSTKGIKAANEITINAGTLFIKAYDDAVHANNDGGTLENGDEPKGNVTINGGVMTVFSNDDGIHADGTVTVNGGTVNVTGSYEGVEGTFVRINGGDVSVVSSDDGFNGTATTGAAIEIAGGRVYVCAGGDGLDSNSRTSKGAILFSGGDVVTICKSGGNSAIDSDGGYTHSGGRVVAVMITGSMTSESANGNSTGMTKKTSLSLSTGGFLTVAVGAKTEAAVRMPCSMTAYIVYLGSANAVVSASASVSEELDANGVFWSDVQQ